MKNHTSIKVISTLLLLMCTISVIAQPWKTTGNSIGATDFLGSTNNFNLVFKTNNVQQMVILTNGNVQVSSLDNGNTGIVTYNATGTLQPLNFSGNATDVLTGNGTFTNFSLLNPWTQIGNNIYYKLGNVGIGTPPNPNNALQVTGNIFASGNITTPSTINAGSITTGNITLSNSMTVPVIYADRIAPRPGDSSLALGDSSLHVSAPPAPINNIWGSNGANLVGSALGLRNQVTGAISTAMGVGNIVSGSAGVAIGSLLNNNIANSIMLGFANPAVFIGQNNLVGIGTSSPQEQLDVNGADPNGEISVFRNGNSIVFLSANMAVGNDNPLTLAHDNGIFWSDQGNGYNSSSGLVIAPHAQSSAGIRIASNGNTTVAGVLSVSSNAVNSIVMNSDQGGAMEIGADNYVANPITGGTPYMDFHYGNGQVQDYNMRIINGKDGELDFVSGFFGGGSLAMSIIGNNNGTYVRAQEIRVCPNNTCDFVFDDKYKLMSLDTLNNYLKLNHHLPGIASAKEMEKEGTISLGKLDMQLLQKVEELTLYTIQLKKQVDDIQQLKDKVVQLENELVKVKQNSK